MLDLNLGLQEVKATVDGEVLQTNVATVAGGSPGGDHGRTSLHGLLALVLTVAGGSPGGEHGRTRLPRTVGTAVPAGLSPRLPLQGEGE